MASAERRLVRVVQDEIWEDGSYLRQKGAVSFDSAPQGSDKESEIPVSQRERWLLFVETATSLSPDHPDPHPVARTYGQV